MPSLRAGCNAALSSRKGGSGCPIGRSLRTGFHRGLTAALRQSLRWFGVSLDEEAAQFVLGGLQPFGPTTVPTEALQEAVNSVLTNRGELMRQWEGEHPGKNPFPPSFPARVLRLANRALEEAYADDSSPEATLLLIKEMCEKELDTGPVSITDEEL